MNREEARIHGLDHAETAWLLREVRRQLDNASQSYELIDGVAFQLTDGRLVGLDNLARRLRKAPRRHWARLVHDQFTALMDARPPTESLDQADLRAKLESPDVLGGLLTYEPLEPLPGLHAVLSAQRPGYTMQMGTLDFVDGSRDDAYAAALTNLAGLPLPRHSRRRVDPRLPESWVEYLHADDPFGASRVMVLPDIMRRVLGMGFPAHGVVVAVPNKFELWVHLPVDVTVVQTTLLLAHDAFTSWATDPFPLSPDLYLVSPDMRAKILVKSDREGLSLDQQVLLNLLRHLPDADDEWGDLGDAG